MARTFNRAYDQADRMLNTSGLSSIVYRQGGGLSKRLDDLGKEFKKNFYESKNIPSTAKMYINAITGKENITDKNVSKFFPQEELNLISELANKNQQLFEQGKIDPSLGQKESRKGQVLNVGTSGKLLNYTQPQTNKALTPDFPYYDPEKEGTHKEYEDWHDKRTPFVSPIMDILNAPSRYNVANTLAKFYYGAPNIAGQRRITDEYDYHFGNGEGTIKEALSNIAEDKWSRSDPVSLRWLLETIGSTVEGSGKDRGPKIDFNAPPPYKDGGWKFNPQTGEYIYDQGQYHPEAIDVEGYSYDPQTNVSSIDGAAIDTTSGLKHGGQTMSRGLSGINKSININGQPHSLAWINPGEASALKAMGGSGRKVGGVPAYFFFDQGGSPEVTGGGDPEAGVDWASDVVTYTDMTLDPGARGDVVEDFTTTTTTDPEEQRGGFDYTEKDVVRMQPPTPRDDSGGDNDYQQSLTEVVENRPRYLVPFWNTLKEGGMSNQAVTEYLAGMGTKGLASLKEAYNTGQFHRGGYSGTMEKILDDQAGVLSEKIKKLIEEDKGIRDQADMLASEKKEVDKAGLSGFLDKAINLLGGPLGTGKEPTSTTIARIKAAADEAGAVFTPVNRNPNVMNAVTNFMIPAIGHLFMPNSIGHITKGGVTFRVNEDGMVTPMENYPSNINEGPDPEPIRRRKQRGGFGVTQEDVEKLQEKPLTGIAAELAKRREVASVAQSRQAQFDNIASIFGREEAAKMLGQPVNIFA